MSLIIKPVSANLQRDTDSFGNMDPFVVLRVGNQERRSSTHQSGGKTPMWSDNLIFNNPRDQLLKVVVWDEDASYNDVVGEGTVNLARFYNMPGPQQEYVNLTYNGRAAGRVLLSIEFQSFGGNFNAGFNQGFNPGGFNQGGFNQGGFNQGGFNAGFNQGGFNQGGFNQGGFNNGW